MAGQGNTDMHKTKIDRDAPDNPVIDEPYIAIPLVAILHLILICHLNWF